MLIVTGIIQRLTDPDTVIPVSNDGAQNKKQDEIRESATSSPHGNLARITQLEVPVSKAKAFATAASNAERGASVLFGNLFSKQYNAAVVLSAILRSHAALVPMVMQTQGFLALLAAVSNRLDHDTQCASFGALRFVVSKSPEVRAWVPGVHVTSCDKVKWSCSSSCRRRNAPHSQGLWFVCGTCGMRVMDGYACARGLGLCRCLGGRNLYRLVL